MNKTYVFSKFRVPMGYIVPSENESIELFKQAQAFLEALLVKLGTTLTISYNDGVYKIYFTMKEEWFIAQTKIERKRSLIYAEAVLANLFLQKLGDFMDDREILNRISSNMIKNCIVADFICSSLKPVFHATADRTDERAIVKMLWSCFVPHLKRALIGELSDTILTSYHRPVAAYSLQTMYYTKSILIFGYELQCTTGANGLLVTYDKIGSLRYVPEHIKLTIVILLNKLKEHLKVEVKNSCVGAEYSDEFCLEFTFSIISWVWLIGDSLLFHSKKTCFQRDISFLEVDIISTLFDIIINRLNVPNSIAERLRCSEEKEITSIVSSMVDLMYSLREFEVWRETGLWESFLWKQKTADHWNIFAHITTLLPRKRKTVDCDHLFTDDESTDSINCLLYNEVQKDKKMFDEKSFSTCFF